jgi:hypothetical protein
VISDLLLMSEKSSISGRLSVVFDTVSTVERLIWQKYLGVISKCLHVSGERPNFEQIELIERN